MEAGPALSFILGFTRMNKLGLVWYISYKWVRLGFHLSAPILALGASLACCLPWCSEIWVVLVWDGIHLWFTLITVTWCRSLEICMEYNDNVFVVCYVNLIKGCLCVWPFNLFLCLYVACEVELKSKNWYVTLWKKLLRMQKRSGLLSNFSAHWPA